jgi:hypothetical protein
MVLVGRSDGKLYRVFGPDAGSFFNWRRGFHLQLIAKKQVAEMFS